MTKTYEEWLEEVGEQLWDNFSRAHNDSLSKVPERFLTEEMCLAAVKADGFALQYVPENLKTYELCLEAVTDSYDMLANLHVEVEDGLALRFVPEFLLDEEICWAAFGATKRALELIPDQFKNAEMCYHALATDTDFDPIEFIPESLLPDVLLWALDYREIDGDYVLKDFPRELLNENLCFKVVSQNPDFLEYMPEEIKLHYSQTLA